MGCCVCGEVDNNAFECLGNFSNENMLYITSKIHELIEKQYFLIFCVIISWVP
jgi:hypothetical protein